MKIAICDDDKIYLDKITNLVSKAAREKNIAIELNQYQNPKLFLKSDLCAYDLVFLDGNMGEISGIDVAKSLRESKADALIIYVSAYLEFAVLGYKVQAFRYILKDSLDSDFEPVFNDALQQLRMQTRRIQVRMNSDDIDFPVKDILYIESDRRLAVFHVCGEEQGLVSYRKLSDLQNELAQSGFVKIQRSYLVNINHIKRINGRAVILDNGTELICSKELQKQVLAEYMLWKGK